MIDSSSMFCSMIIKEIINRIKSKTDHDEYNLSRCTGYVTHNLTEHTQIFEMHCHMDCCSKVWVYVIVENTGNPNIPLGTRIINRTAFDINDITLIDHHVSQIINSYKKALSFTPSIYSISL